MSDRFANKPKGESTGKLEFIEGMRAIAALYVVLSHFCSMVDPKYLQTGKSVCQPWQQKLMAPFWYGHFAVAAFIVISGFCLQLALYRSGDGRLLDVPKFFRRRARRILPAYYACLVFSILVCVWVTQQYAGLMPFQQYVPLTRENVAAHFLLVHNLSPDWMYKINGVLWSIAIEAQLYLAFPVLGWMLHRWGRIQLLVPILCLCALSVWLYPPSVKLYPWFAFLFAAGMVSADLAYRPHLKLGTLPNSFGISACVFFAATYLLSSNRSLSPVSDITMGLGVACLLYVLTVTTNSAVSRLLSWKPLVQVGLFSYSLYLIHHPIQQILYVFRPVRFQGPAASLAYLIFLGLPVILFCSYWFFRSFEQPFIAVTRRGQTQPRPGTVVAQLPLQVARIESDDTKKRPDSQKSGR